MKKRKRFIYPINPHEADRTASLMFISFDNRSKNANILFRCGVIIDKSTWKLEKIKKKSSN